MKQLDEICDSQTKIEEVTYFTLYIDRVRLNPYLKLYILINKVP